jgi:hypothetical protein
MDMTWVTERVALGGGIWNARNMEELAEAGVTHVLNMQVEFDDRPLAEPLGVRVLWNPTDDDFLPKPPELLKRGVDFALAALDDTAHADKTRRKNSSGLKSYARAFRKLGLEFIPSSANFILVRVGDGQRVFNEMQKLGVIVRPMAGYQLPDWVRLSIGTPKQNQRCLEALQTALAKPEPSAV